MGIDRIKKADFVAIKNGVKTYMQVCGDISRKETSKREAAPLLSVKDAYPKIIITRTKHAESRIKEIKVTDIAT